MNLPSARFRFTNERQPYGNTQQICLLKNSGHVYLLEYCRRVEECRQEYQKYKTRFEHLQQQVWTRFLYS